MGGRGSEKKARCEPIYERTEHNDAFGEEMGQCAVTEN